KTPRDMCHAHDCALTDWNNGTMDGWDAVTGSTSNGDDLAYAQYQEKDIPNYWASAKAFTLGDHFFANVLGPSFPGHLFVPAARLAPDIPHPALPPGTWFVSQDLADEHPTIGGVCAGENWTVGMINLIMKSPDWKDTAILFTRDDFGGWYDHVAPPRQYGCDAKTPYGLGFRLPLIIISPYAKPHSIFKEVSEHASIPRFLERVFNAPALSTMDPGEQAGGAN